MSKVYIGIGHGGKDPGAVAQGYKEKDLAMSIGTHLDKVLKRCGITTLMSRSKDEFDEINQKVAECNNFGADLCVELHINAGSSTAKGAEVYHSINGGVSKTLATNILNEIVALGQENRGIKTKLNSRGTDYFGMIRDTKCASVLIEYAFIDSADIQIVDTDTERQAMAEATAKGVCKTLGKPYIAPNAQPTPVPIVAPVTQTTAIKVGDKVTIKVGSVYGGLSSTRGKAIPAEQTASKKHTVSKIQINNKVNEALLKDINSWVAVSSLNRA